MIEEPINCSVSNKTYIFADIFWVRSNESSFGPKVRCAFVLIVWDIVRELLQVVMGKFHEYFASWHVRRIVNP